MVQEELILNIEETKTEEGKKLKGIITVEKDNKTYLTIKDYQPKEKKDTFVRNSGNKTLFINKGEIIREEIKRKNTCIKKKKKDKEPFDFNNI
jgi:predicted RNA-binding protein with RPS1 domain